MFILNIAAVAVILANSGLHLLWAMKFWWPISDQKRLVRAVAGFPNVDRMLPPIACLFVAVTLLGVAILLIFRLTQSEQQDAVSIGLFGAGLVFVGRGALGFTGLWSRLIPVQPFRKLDRRFYSPLSLAIGAVIFTGPLF